MKKIIILAITLAVICAKSEAQKYISIYQNGNVSNIYRTDEIDSISLSPSEYGDSPLVHFYSNGNEVGTFQTNSLNGNAINVQQKEETLDYPYNAKIVYDFSESMFCMKWDAQQDNAYPYQMQIGYGTYSWDSPMSSEENGTYYSYQLPYPSNSIAGVNYTSYWATIVDEDYRPVNDFTMEVLNYTEEEAIREIDILCHESLNAYGIYNGAYALENCTDLGWCSNGWWSFFDYYDIAHGTAGPYSTLISNIWKRYFNGINYATFIIRLIQKSNIANKELYIGEARFIRGLLYFDMMNRWGGVPVINEEDPLPVNEVDSPRSSEEETRQQVLADLTYAIEHCENVPASSTEVWKPSQAAAYALRGKVYLFNKQYEEAIADFSQVVNGGYGFELEKDFSALFRPTGYKNGADDGKEIIFAVEHDGQSLIRGMETQFLTFRSSMGNGINVSRAMPTLVNMAESKATGQKPTQAEMESWLSEGGADGELGYANMTSDSYEDRKTFWATTSGSPYYIIGQYPEWREGIRKMWASLDPRLGHTIILPYEYYLGWGTTNYDEVNAGGEAIVGEKLVENVIWETGQCGNTAYGTFQQEYGQNNYVWRKFVEEGDWGGQFTTRDQSPVNWPIIRYADVLLMLAEAYVCVGNSTAAAKYVNQVRARVEMPAKSAVTMDDIEYERCMEFALEGQRYWDLKRWGKYCSTLNGLWEVDVFGDIKGQQYNFNQQLWEGLGSWPIPSTEHSDQNPNWR